MKTEMNRQWCLAAYPVGEVKESDFEYRETSIPSPKTGEVLVRILYLSIDPIYRLWMSDIEDILPSLKLGEVMRGINVGIVED